MDYDDCLVDGDHDVDSFRDRRNGEFRRFHCADILRRLSNVSSMTGVPAALNSAPPLSRAGINIRMLGQLLNLTLVERGWLLGAYCLKGSDVPKTPVIDRRHAYAMMARLWNLPPEHVLFAASPNRLRALELLDGVRATPDQRRRPLVLCLDDFLGMPDAAAEFLSRPHRSHAVLLNAMLAPRVDPVLEEFQVLRSDVRPWLPRLVEQAGRMEEVGVPTTAHHLAALVQWHGGPVMRSEQFTELAGRLDMLAVRQAVKHAVFRCCQLQPPVTAFAVLKELYAAAM